MTYDEALGMEAACFPLCFEPGDGYHLWMVARCLAEEFGRDASEVARDLRQSIRWE